MACKVKVEKNLLLLFLRKFYNFFLDIIYPNFCRSCFIQIKSNEIFCNTCLSTIKPVASLDLNLTLAKKITVFAVSPYRNPLKKLILDKFYSQSELSSKQLAWLIYQKTIVKNLKIDFLVPIPLHWTRYAKRGYNQSYIIAKELSKLLGVSLLNVLKRNRKTLYQSTLSFDDRQKNLKDVFGIKYRYKKRIKYLLKNKNIMIVDDLLTTGATLKNSSKLLFKFNPNSINAVVACRVI